MNQKKIEMENLNSGYLEESSSDESDNESDKDFNEETESDNEIDESNEKNFKIWESILIITKA